MKYRVLKELYHGGKDYVRGDEIDDKDLDAELVPTLLNQGVIEAPKAEKPPKEKSTS